MNPALRAFASGAVSASRRLFLIALLLLSSVPLAAQSSDSGALGPDGFNTAVRFGSIVPIVRETGKITLSVDGFGSTSASGIIQVEKPAGATVRGAYLAAASTGGSGVVLNDGDVSIDGQPVTFSIQTASSIFSSNHWANVTALVKSKLDAAPAGRVNFTITENSSWAIDGEILAVIFDDPGQTTDNTIALLFGAQAVGGDTFNLLLSEPLDKSDPNLGMTMSLGISFGFQLAFSGGQHSIVDVNTQRLTTSAGGQDDGASSNGALITVGGLDDLPANPPDPFATSSAAGFRTDDELYDLVPLLTNGIQTISVFTRNPSSDDNIFFAAFNLRSTTAVVGEGIVLSPVSATVEAGTPHTVTASMQNSLGQPVVGRTVTFTITHGPNAGLSGTATTAADGSASFSYTSSAAGSDTIQATALDNSSNLLVSNDVVVVWLQTNVAPSLECPGAVSLEQTSLDGTSVTLVARVTDADAQPLEVVWSVDGVEVQTDSVLGVPEGWTEVAFTHAFGVGTHSVSIDVSDGHGGEVSCTVSVEVVLDHTPPGVTAPPSQSLVGGCTAPLPDFTSSTVATDNVTPVSQLVVTQTPAAGTIVGLGSTVVTITVTDLAGNSTSVSTSFLLTNALPTASAGGPYTVAEGGSVVLTGAGIDDLGIAAYAWDLDDNGSFETISGDGQAVFSAALLDGPSVRNVHVLVTDTCGQTATASATVSITNVDPVVTITAPAGGALFAAGSTVSLAAAFSDAGIPDTHTCSVFWDNVAADPAGSTASGTVVEASGSGTCSASYLFANAGVYSLTVTITDDDGGSASAGVLIVVYDASAGFVTGGGWINSPAGAWVADPSLAGKANFGFVSKYHKGAVVPTGETEFQFHVAGLNFHSVKYDWLVIAGAKAQYKGEGTVNGATGYAFLLTATDGQMSGGGGVDRFRIKIWNKASGDIVYDNVGGAAEDLDGANPQVLGGGSIVIHSK